MIFGILFGLVRALVVFFKRPVVRPVTSVVVGVVQLLAYARVLHSFGRDGRGWLIVLFAIAVFSAATMYRKVLASP